MVLCNSTPNANSSKANALVINTAALKGEDLAQFIQLSEEIESRRAQRQSPSVAGTGKALLKATMTREELFETSSLDDDRFWSELEHQNSYIEPKQEQATTDLNLSSIGNLMKYFDEDVPLTPPKRMQVINGKVANVIAAFKSKAANLSPAHSPRKTNQNKIPEARAKILELKKKYETQSNSSETPVRQLLTKSQKFPKKVKEMAQHFNSKIAQVMRSNSDMKDYEPLKNDFSPEAKPTPIAKPTYRLPSVSNPVPSPSSHNQETNANSTVQSHSCHVAEDVFHELSVKDKILLFNKFIGAMSQKNAEFSKHADVIKENLKKQMTRGEVINEKQATVKDLAQELEAKCVINSHLQRVQSVRCKKRSAPLPPTNQAPKAKEAEDVLSGNAEDSIHVSTLTVILKPSPDLKSRVNQTIPQRTLPAKRRDLSFHDIESSQKRSIESLCSALPYDAFAPPKKIRRTCAERHETKMFFQNEPLENLFYSWLKEENGELFVITSVSNTADIIEIANDAIDSINKTSDSEITQKSAVERLLEEAIAKLEESKLNGSTFTVENNVDTSNKQKEGENQEGENTPLSTPTPNATPAYTPRRIKRQAPPPPIVAKMPVPAPRKNLSSAPSLISSNSSSAKQSEAEMSESGLSALPKISSDESQPEVKASSGSQPDFEFTKPVRPLRKKKMRRALTWKKENSIIETFSTITTTDSDSDSKQIKDAKTKKPFTSFAKQYIQNKINMLTTPKKTQQDQSSFVELDKSLMRIVNSPRKIKSAYTLTAMSSPFTESDNGGYEPQATPRQSLQTKTRVTTSSLDADKTCTDNLIPNDLTNQKQQTQQQQPLQPTQLVDSFIDQGFETGSNDLDSPIRWLQTNRQSATPQPQPPQTLPRSKATALEIEKASARRVALEFNNNNKNVPESPPSYSTPVKGHMQRTFSIASSTHQPVISPIATQQNSLKQRRRSTYENDSRRSSIAMQVIREDQPLHIEGTPTTPRSPCTPLSDSAFFGNASTADTPANLEDVMAAQPVSNFWIVAGEFTISAEIYYTPPERLSLLYEIFTQKSFETEVLCFGIDSHKFVLDSNKDYAKEHAPERVPSVQGCSHYWFSTGDLAVPFSGKHMSADKITRLFRFINQTIAQNEQLHFGVDNFDFSDLPEFWHNTPKFSMESNYSMLVGLQAGNSNGLEGRSKYAWPSSTRFSCNSSMTKNRDLDQSEFESDGFSSNTSNSGSQSLSPFDSNNCTSDDQQCNISPEIFSSVYENEPLDQLFKEAKKSTTKSDMSTREHSMTVSQMLETLQQQKYKLKSIETRMRSYLNSKTTTHHSADVLKDDPKYIRKLHSIVKMVDNIGRDNGFKGCTKEQLEEFMFFLSHYADICLAKSSEHMVKILETLMDRRAVVV